MSLFIWYLNYDEVLREQGKLKKSVPRDFL